MAKREGKMPGYFPIMLKAAGRPCAVVGGGEVARRKVKTLIESGAAVRVISPALDDELKALAEQGRFEWRPREYRPGDLAGAFLVVAASDAAEVNQAARKEAAAAGALVNVADDPEGSDYQVPSFFENGPLLIAVSTGGLSPAVSRTLRRMIQAYLGESFGSSLQVIAEFRERVKSEVPSAKDRGRFWETAVTPGTLELARAGNLPALKQSLQNSLVRFLKSPAK